MTVPARLPQRSIRPTRSDADALKSVAAWLPSVAADQRVPADKAELIPAAMRAVELALRPASVEQIAVELDKLVRWAAAFNIPAKDFGAATEFYIEGLRGLPSDLLPLAMERARANHRWGQRLPLASEIADQVRDEMRVRQMHRSKLFLASRLPVRREPQKSWAEMTEAERSLLNSAVTALKAKWPTYRTT